MPLRKISQKTRYWGSYWIPMMVIGGGFSLLRFRARPKPELTRIVIFLLEHLGDAVMSVPMIRGLKSVFPQAQITIVASPVGAAYMKLCPYIDDLISMPKPMGWRLGLCTALRTAFKLRRLMADLVVVPNDAVNDGFNDLVALATYGRWKVSLKPPGRVAPIKPMKCKLHYDDLIETHGVKHEAAFRLDIARHYASGLSLDTGLEAWIDPNDLSSCNFFLSKIRDDEATPLIAFGIGASKIKRRWPLRYFAEVINRISRRLSFIPLLIIGPDEGPLANELTSLTMVPVHFMPQASVGESAALIAQCVVFIGNDSGPMHLAASLRIPVVEISCHPIGAGGRHFNSPIRCGPLGVKCEILQPQPMDHRCINGCSIEDQAHCITQILPETVVEAALKLLPLCQSSGLREAGA